MRLTLRTLLAYMDGLLDSKDSQEIGKKIEDSKYATDLFHKIRDVMRRLRLAAPSVTERGTNLDCNSVAEYLDNVLPAERVPEFEEVCLKSEMHLAEVASAHQILTMVLGEPAEIEPESRQRMYQLPTLASRVDEERVAAAEAASVLSGEGKPPSVEGNGAASTAAPANARPRPVVPEYLREPAKKRRLLPAAAMTFFLAAAATLVLWFLGQLKSNAPVGKALQWVEDKFAGKPVAMNDGHDADRGANQPAASDDAAKASGGNTPANNAATGGTAAAAGSGQAAPPTPSGSNAAPPPARPGPSEQPVPAAEPVLAHPAAPAQPEAGLPLLVAPTVPSVGAEVPAAPAPGGEAPATTPPSPSAPAAGQAAPARANDLAAGPQIVPVPPPHATIVPATPIGPVAPPAAGPANPSELARVDPLAPPPGAQAEQPAAGPSPEKEKAKVARFTSDGQDVLLKYDAANSVWRRVMPEEFLAASKPLLALPSYRPRIDVFDVGATLELVNGTRIEILPAAAAGPLGVKVDYGRLVVKPLAQAGTRLRIATGTHSGTLTLGSVESVAGLEVTHVHEPGTDPEKVLSHAMTKLYVARGGAAWEEKGKRTQLKGPAALLLDGGDGEAAAADVPKWLTVDTLSDLDQRGAIAVSKALPAERSATLGLMELTDDRRREVSGLAARCLCYLGQYDPVTSALNESSFHSQWLDYFGQLQEAVARGPETAAGIRQSIERQYGNDASQLYRMLWGYTDKDLEAGEDARLVKDLDNEGLIFRVLAFANLQEIAHKQLYYRPEAPAPKRQPAVQRWKVELQAGRIRYAPAAEVKRSPAPRPAESGSAAPSPIVPGPTPHAPAPEPAADEQ